MRATIILFSAAIALGACSKGEGDQTGNDLASSGKDLAAVAHHAASSPEAATAVHDLANSGKDLAGVARQAATAPEWAQTREDLRRLGHDIGQATREGAAGAKAVGQQATEDAKRETHKLAEGARHAGHDQRQRDDNGSAG
jgi:hypothetical protein